ncbi:hypothetical protein B0T24DRAFT_279830 [Lasiosphaeria ovina]|uniref:Secreted protein n=1 Tax=Lasiosphaeria ovina TaxID=92902 RepID=A0AAE0N7Q7_9PEZI|nr:hypothetical protein B0T24DRAFT_279830 [Lasiosphaeria ovina]
MMRRTGRGMRRLLCIVLCAPEIGPVWESGAPLELPTRLFCPTQISTRYISQALRICLQQSRTARFSLVHFTLQKHRFDSCIRIYLLPRRLIAQADAAKCVKCKDCCYRDILASYGSRSNSRLRTTLTRKKKSDPYIACFGLPRSGGKEKTSSFLLGVCS